MTFSFTHYNAKFITKKSKKTSFEILFLAILMAISSPKTSYAYYAKAFKTGFVETFNVFYTRHDNNVNALYTCNDIEVGFSKNLLAELF